MLTEFNAEGYDIMRHMQALAQGEMWQTTPRQAMKATVEWLRQEFGYQLDTLPRGELAVDTHCPVANAMRLAGIEEPQVKSFTWVQHIDGVRYERPLPDEVALFVSYFDEIQPVLSGDPADNELLADLQCMHEDVSDSGTCPECGHFVQG